MSENVQIAIIGLIGSLLSALISGIVTLAVSERKLGCRTIGFTVALFGVIGFTVTVLVAALLISPPALQANRPQSGNTIFPVEPAIPTARPEPSTIVERTDDQPRPASPTPTTDIVATHRPHLISAIRLADSAEARALFTLDPSPLYNSYAGEALKTVLANLEDLRSRGLYIDARLEDQDFQSFKVSADGRQAEVFVVETWVSTWYQALSHQCVVHFPSYEVPQTIFLERGANGWIVVAIVTESEQPQPAACQ